MNLPLLPGDKPDSLSDPYESSESKLLGLLKKYALFRGRASRKEFWIIWLINYGVFFSLAEAGLTSSWGYVYILAFLYPSIAVGVRRLHDTNRRGWWYLMAVVPTILTQIIFLYLAGIKKGTDGHNDYGADPLYSWKHLVLDETEESQGSGLRQRYSLKGIGTAICWLSGIALLPLGYGIVADFRLAGMLNDLINRPSLIYQSSFESNLNSIEDNGLTAYGLAILCGLVAFVLLVIWSWRSNKNIQMWEQQAGRDMRRGAGWAIGGWFIPFGNLFIPYQTIQDAWQRAPLSDTSRQKHHDPSRNNTWLICWLTWVVGISLSQIARILPDDTLNGLRTNYFISGFSSILQAVSAITLIITVKQISERHSAFN